MARKRRETATIGFRLTLPQGAKFAGIKAFYIYTCSSGYQHDYEGEFLSREEIAAVDKIAAIRLEDKNCLHCPDCGCEVDPGFKPCGGFGRV